MAAPADVESTNDPTRRRRARGQDGGRQSAVGLHADPSTNDPTRRLVVRMAVDNPRWGYTRIRGALSNLGHTIARTTVKRILHDHGVDPAPERSRHMPWKTFLQAHWEGLAACDLFTVEVLTLAGLRRYLVFFVIELRSRRVTIAGIHPQPGGAWMEQQARNLTDPVDGCLRRARHLIHDRDPLYTRVFGEILESAGVQPIGCRRRVPISTPMPACFRHCCYPALSVLTTPLRPDIQYQRAASVKIGWKYLDD